MGISISILAYNEEATIADVINRSVKALSELTGDYEVIVINDCSTDATAEIAGKLAAGNPRIRIVSHKENLGIGPTLKDAFYLPSKEWAMHTSGDAQFPPENLKRFYERRNESDFILGYRKLRHDSWNRKINSFIYNSLIKLVSGKNIRDVNSIAFFRPAQVKTIPINSGSVFVHAEVLLGLLKKGFKVSDVEIEHHFRAKGKASGSKPFVIFETIRDLVKYLVSK